MKRIATAAFAITAFTLAAGTNVSAGLRVIGEGNQGPIVGAEKLTVPVGRPLGQKPGSGANARTVPFGLIPAIRPKSPPKAPARGQGVDVGEAARTHIATIRDSQITGRVSQEASAGETVNISVGRDAETETEIAVVRGSQVSGKVEQDAVVQRSVNIAKGTRAEATTGVSVVEEAVVTGKATQSVTLDTSTTIAEGTDSKATTHIGSISGSMVSGVVNQTATVKRTVNLAKE